MFKNDTKNAIIKSGWNELAQECADTKSFINNYNRKMTITTKRYLISSLVTFLTGFAGVILLDIDKITLTSFSDGAVVGIVFTAIRAGVKAVLEYLLTK